MDCDIKQKVCLKKNKAQLTELALEKQQKQKQVKIK